MRQAFFGNQALKQVGRTASAVVCTVFVFLALPQARAGTAMAPSVSAPNPGVDVVEKSDQQLPVTFSLNFDSVYDDNIYIRNQNRVGDFYWMINPGVSYVSGDPQYQPDQLFRLSYKPKIYQFWDETKNNSFDQDLHLDYQVNLGHLTLGLAQTYYTDSTPTPDTGGRLKAQYYDTHVFANYELSPRLTWENEVTQLISRYDSSSAIETNAWTASSYLDYAVCPKFNLAVGGTLGYVVLDQYPDQFYEQFNLRMKYKATNKINLTARVGGEYRQFEHSNDNSISPVFALGAEFHPGLWTTLKVDGEGKTLPSISDANQNYRTYGLNVSLRQQIVPHFFLNLGSGYYHSFYYNTPSGDSAGFQYDFITVRPALEWELNPHFTVGAYYQHQTNISNQDDQSYLDNQVGIQGGFKY